MYFYAWESAHFYFLTIKSGVLKVFASFLPIALLIINDLFQPHGTKQRAYGLSESANAETLLIISALCIHVTLCAAAP